MATSQFRTQQRFMSKYLSKAATKRLPLTTKRAGKGYYKGKGGTKEGRITSKGKFIVDPKKRVQLMVPDLEGFKVSYRNRIIGPLPVVVAAGGLGCFHVFFLSDDAYSLAPLLLNKF